MRIVWFPLSKGILAETKRRLLTINGMIGMSICLSPNIIESAMLVIITYQFRGESLPLFVWNITCAPSLLVICGQSFLRKTGWFVGPDISTSSLGNSARYDPNHTMILVHLGGSSGGSHVIGFGTSRSPISSRLLSTAFVVTTNTVTHITESTMN